MGHLQHVEKMGSAATTRPSLTPSPTPGLCWQVLGVSQESGRLSPQLHEIHHQPVVPPFPVHRRLCTFRNAALWWPVSAEQLLRLLLLWGLTQGPLQTPRAKLGASRDAGPSSSCQLPFSWPGCPVHAPRQAEPWVPLGCPSGGWRHEDVVLETRC